MSNSHHLVCLDTGEVLDLGKLAIDPGTGKYSFGAVPFGLSDGSNADGQARSALKIMALTHFLVRNRGRSLVVISEPMYGANETDFFPTSSSKTSIPLEASDYEELLAKPVGSPHDWYDDRHVPEYVTKRLGELSRGENIETLPWDKPAEKGE